MYTFLVTSSSSKCYEIQAHRFEITQGILYFYDQSFEVMLVIKDWDSFFSNKEEDQKSPDEYFDAITEEDEEEG